MVAVSKRPGVTLREAEFIREYVACKGNASEAYRRAYTYSGKHADMLAQRVFARPHVREALEVARDAALTDVSMDMRERRAILGKIGRHKAGWRAAPTYGERIAAIREDATLAGERNEQVSISGEVSVRACLLALSLDGSSLTTGGGLGSPQMSGEGGDSGSGSQALETDPLPPCEASPLDVVADVVPSAGPVGGEYEE